MLVSITAERDGQGRTISILTHAPGSAAQDQPPSSSPQAQAVPMGALLQSASLGGVVAVGPRAGCRVRRTQRLGGP